LRRSHKIPSPGPTGGNSLERNKEDGAKQSGIRFKKCRSQEKGGFTDWYQRKGPKKFSEEPKEKIREALFPQAFAGGEKNKEKQKKGDGESLKSRGKWRLDTIRGSEEKKKNNRSELNTRGREKRKHLGHNCKKKGSRL